MFIEVIHYNTETGIVTSRYTMNGDVDAEAHPHTDPEAGILRYDEPSEERDKNFISYTGQTVVDGELVFGYEPWPEPVEQPTYEELMKGAKKLGYGNI